MTVAAFILSIVSAAAAVVAVVVAWVSIGIARRATRAAEASVVEARRSADAAERMRGIEEDRRYEEMRPALEGQVVPSPNQDGSQPQYKLEVWLKTPEPLMWITMTILPNTGFYHGSHLMPVDLSYPIGERRAPIKTRSPVSWPVSLSATGHGTVVVTAKCRMDNGTYYEGIEVPIDLDTAKTDRRDTQLI